MRETIKGYKIDVDRYLNPRLRFELTDGADVIEQLTEDLWGQKGQIEIELTVRYLGRSDK